MPTSPTGILGTIGISRRTNYAVSFNGVDMGLVDDVDPTGVKMSLDPIMTGSTGKKNKLGDRVVGVDGSIKIQFRQLSAAQYAALAPWNVGWVSGAIQLVPPLNSDLYTFSKSLILHPLDVAGTTEDINFAHACPSRLPMPKRTGGQDDVLEIEFNIYPDRTTLSTTPLAITPGAIGP